MTILFSNLWCFGGLLKSLMPKLNAQAGAMVGTTCTFNEINTKNDTTSNTNTQYTKTNNKTDMQERNETADASRSGNKIAVDSKKDTIENFNEYTEHVIGKTPGVSFSKLLKEFRETFLNIDNMVINELSDLFFGLW